MVDESQEKAQEEHESLLAQFEQKRKMREIALPATDKGVKLKLRSLDLPICLFGEEARDRRERLREILAQAGDESGAGEVQAEGDGEEDGEDEGPKDDRYELFYTEVCASKAIRFACVVVYRGAELVICHAGV